MLPLPSFLAHPSDYPIPVFVSPPFLLPPSPLFLSLSLLLLFLFFSQPGSISLWLLSSSLKQPWFFVIWFPISAGSPGSPAYFPQAPSCCSTILLSWRVTLLASVSQPLSLNFTLSLFLSLSSACSPLGLPHMEPLSHSVSLAWALWPALSLCF